MHLKTMQLSCSRLTSSPVYSVDCSCLHLALISESHGRSFRSIENAVSAPTVQLRRLLTNISLHKRDFIWIIYGSTFHTLSLVSLREMLEKTLDRLVLWPKCGPVSVVFRNISVIFVPDVDMRHSFWATACVLLPCFVDFQIFSSIHFRLV